MRREFITLSMTPQYASLDMIRSNAFGCLHTTKSMAQGDLCLSCLAHRPHAALSCGHRVCDWCVQRHGGPHGLNKCLVCGVDQANSLQAKPRSAGARILSLQGAVEDAPAIARCLRSLRSELRSPLWQHFDLVVGDGVGLFFVLMLFCKQASVADCQHHLGNLKSAKLRASEFNFGPNLRFARTELRNTASQRRGGRLC